MMFALAVMTVCVTLVSGDGMTPSSASLSCYCYMELVIALFQPLFYFLCWRLPTFSKQSIKISPSVPHGWSAR